MDRISLKECPRCMGDIGFQRISHVQQTEYFRWGSIGPYASQTKSLEHFADHCICCGVIVEEELEQITKETPTT